MHTPVQDAFARALLDPDLPPPAAVTSHTARVPTRRFDVYRNNVVAGLIDALRTRFPATERIVGDAFFVATARVFVADHPPRSKLLMHYGDEFPDFLARFAPAAELPYLPDVARVEAARTRAYHAADAAPLDPETLHAIDPDRLWTARLALHPSVEIVRSRYPIVTIWAMNSGEAELGAVDFDRAEDALIARPHGDVLVRALPPGGAAFLDSLRAGAALGAAAEAAMAAHAEFDLAANLAGLLGSGALAGLSLATAKD